MFTASYPANLLPEAHGKGFHVRFPDLPEALTGGDDLTDTLGAGRRLSGGSDCRPHRPR
jgi:predicted RNase H-like HicB family nuclease